MHYQAGRLRETLKSGWCRFCLTAFGFLLLGGCGVGSGGSDSGNGSGAAGGSSTPPEQLSIKLEGQVKYRADEGVSLSYTVSGSSAASATAAYDGPVELNQVAAKLIEELQKNIDKSGEQILLHIADQLKHSDPNVVIKGGFEVMQNFKNKDILLGT